MDVLVNLRTFLMVVRCGGFSEAARHMHVVPSVAAKRIAQLEATVGARLFTRSTRSVGLTEAGAQLHARASNLVSEFDEVVGTLKRDRGQPEGNIRLMSPTTLTLIGLGKLFAEFMRAHPRIRLDITLVDVSSNPLEGGYDIAISGRSASYEGVVDVPLCTVQPVLCAAPGYLGVKGTPAHPRELVEHDCLVFRPMGTHWRFQSARGTIGVDVPARLTADDNLTLLQAAIGGCGVAIVPTYVARTALRSGQITTLLPDFPPQENWFRAYVPSRKRDLVHVKTLLDWLSAHVPQALNASTDSGDAPSTDRKARGARLPRQIR